MKNLIKTTKKLTNALDTLRLKRMATISITDKAMSHLAVDVIAVGELKHISFYDVIDDETGEVNTQVVFGTENGNYSTCSKVVSSLADDIYDLVTSGDVKLDDVGIEFSFANSRNGNKFLNAEIM